MGIEMHLKLWHQNVEVSEDEKKGIEQAEVAEVQKWLKKG